MINQEFKAQERNYQVLPKFRICCWELGGLKLGVFRACVRSFCSVIHIKFKGIKKKDRLVLRKCDLTVIWGKIRNLCIQ